MMKGDKDVYLLTDQVRKRFIKTLVYLGLIFDPLYVAVTLIRFPDISSVSSSIVDLIVFSIVLFLLRYEKFNKYIYATFVVFCMGMTYFLLVDGPVEVNISNYIFVSMIPIITIFLLGKKNGAISLVLYAIGLILLTLFKFYTFYELNSTPLIETLFQVIFVFVIISLAVYFYEDTLEIGKKQIFEDNNKINKSFAEIQKKSNELLKQKDDLERLNKLMIGREIRMIELKKELEKANNKV